MKQHELETGTIGFQKIPECLHFQHEVTIHEPIQHFIHYYTGIEDDYGHYHNLEAHDIELPFDFISLGIFSQLKEEDVKDVMPYDELVALAKHLGLDAVNPYGEKRECKGRCLKCDRWQEAQSKVKQYFVVFKAKDK